MDIRRFRRKLSQLLSGHKLFLKIFLWFWLTVLGLLVVVFVRPRLTNIQVLRPPNMNATIAPILAAQAVRAYEREGVDGFARYAAENVDDSERKVYLLDGFYHDVLSRPISAQGLALAHMAHSGELLTDRSHIVAYRYISSSGTPYIFLLYRNADLGVVLGRMRTDEMWFLFEVFLVVTTLCYWLAHHIAAPIMEIKDAAQRVSHGDLRARAPSALLKRHDELSDLGRDFNTMVERIEALVQTHKRLLASVSHEVRSPLTRLAVTSALLRRQRHDLDELLLDRIDREVETMDVLMSQLLTLARLEGGVQHARREVVELTPMLEEIAANADFEGTAMNKEVQLQMHADVTLWSADGVAIRSALENIIRNAMRFAPPNSLVEVNLRVEDGDRPEAILLIGDCGPGVPDEHLAAIFQPFFRVPGSGTTSTGNGLGLTIAAEAVHLHEGSLTARNRAGGGLEIEVRLPIEGARGFDTIGGGHRLDQRSDSETSISVS